MKRQTLLFSTFCTLGLGFFGGMFYSSWLKDNVCAQIVSVHDGDTFTVNMVGWPEVVGKKIGIRIKGIDTPELHDKRAEMRAKAMIARTFTCLKLKSASVITLQNLSRDKYFRLDADVLVDGQDLGKMLLERKLAVPYDGGTKH